MCTTDRLGFHTGAPMHGSDPEHDRYVLLSELDGSGAKAYTDSRARPVASSTADLWLTIEGFGSANEGHTATTVAWTVRGWLDRAVRGDGLRRGRRDPYRLAVGDTADFWRVEDVRRVPPATEGLLQLRAEMRLPGRAWLEMRAVPTADGACRYEQRSVFLPRGLAGHAYWASIRPFHAFIFDRMARGIVRSAERRAARAAGPAQSR